jgi:GT2 family glycosyltransferase
MIGVVIPAFNKAHLTERCLRSLLDSSSRVSEVIVIDNASQDQTPILLSEWRKHFLQKGIPFETIRNPNNVGFGRACNQGIRMLTQPWIVILNNDTWLSPGWDQALVRDAERFHFDLIGPHFDERPWPEAQDSLIEMKKRAQDFLRINSNRKRNHFVPILMCFRRSAVEALRLDHGGIFDERFFVTYEDTDLRFRMEQMQLRFGQTSNAFIWHQSMGTRSTPGLLPEGYEADGLRIFKEKWGFDPRISENTLIEKWKRKIRKWNSSQGRF